MARSAKTGSPELAAMIQSRREQMGLRRRDLVEATGLSYPYISQLETGYRLPSDRALRDLAAALSLDPAELLAVMPEERRTTSSPLAAAASTTPRWHLNPAAVMPDALRESPRERSADDVVIDILRQLEPMDADAAIDVLAEVQRRLVRRLVRAGRR